MPIAMALAIAGIFAALGFMAADGAATVISVLFWMWCLFAVVNTAVPLTLPDIPRDRRTPANGTHRIWPWTQLAMGLLWRVLLVALLIGGHYGLAALQGYSMLLATARRAEIRRNLGEWHKVGPISRAVHRLVFSVRDRLAPLFRPLGRLLTRPVWDMPLIAWFFVVPLIPLLIVLWIPVGLFEILRVRARQTKSEYELVKTACADGRLAWFAYAEPHQRERFLGEGGVLHGMDGNLIVRDWRRDLYTAWNGDTEQDIDAMIVKRFRLTNMKEDLPVIVLFHPDGRTRPLMLNRAYRQRFRDGGDLLAALEDTLRQQMRELRQPAV